MEILKQIVKDAAALCSNVAAAGVVGSFAKGNHNHKSDVDLLVKPDYDHNFQHIMETFGEYIRRVLDYQFNKRLEIIRYNMAVDRSQRDPGEHEIWFYRNGFAEVLKDVIWLYERPDHHFENPKLSETGEKNL